MEAKTIAAFDAALLSPKWPWYIFGPAGTGKTCAAACVYRHWPFNGLFRFWDCGSVVRDFVRRRVDSTEGIIIRTIKECELLVLDDIATRECTDAQMDAILSIVNARAKKPMIITGNQSPKELAEVLKDDRIPSRICGTLFHLLGKDQRLQQARLFQI